MDKRKYRFGIDVIGTCKSYEDSLQKELKSGVDLEYLLTRHLEKIRWLQHERLIHLIVTALTSIVLMMLLILLQISSYPIPILILFLIMLVLTGCYLVHYFRLENTVQHWYIISDLLDERIHKNTPDAAKSGESK